MRRGGRARLPLLIILALVLSASSARALTIETTQVFATTRAETVEWKVSETITLNSLTVNATQVSFDAYGMDFYPRTGGNTLTVTVNKWATDFRKWTVASTGATIVDFTIANPGLTWNLTIDGVLALTCLPGTTPCRLALDSATSWTLTMALPNVPGAGTGSALPASSTSTSPPLAADSSGGAAAAAPTVASLAPPDVFPRFSLAHWAVFITGLALVLGSFQLTADIVPIPIPRSRIVLFLGAALLMLVYLSAASVAAPAPTP